MTEKNNPPGRQTNDAQPLGETPGLKSDHDQAKTAKRSQEAAGPDGGDAREVGDTFKH